MTKLGIEAAKEHREWRNRVAKELPDLGRRVFELRDGGWVGCGFHYDMERNYGRLIMMVNDRVNPMEDYTPSVDQVNYNALVESVLKAEWSKAHNGKSPYAEGAPWHVDEQAKLEEAMRMIETLADGIDNSTVDHILDIRNKLLYVSEEEYVELMDASYPIFIKEFVNHYLGHRPLDDAVMTGLWRINIEVMKVGSGRAWN